MSENFMIDDAGVTLFEKSVEGRSAHAQLPPAPPAIDDIPQAFVRKQAPKLPQVSELQVVRHFTNLSSRNFAIDRQFYPLGSCTMKYNPRGAHAAASLPGFLGRHPLAPASISQGLLSVFFDLQETLKDVTGMKGVSLPPAGSRASSPASR